MSKELILDKIRKIDDPFEAQEIERKKLISELEGKLTCNIAVLYHNLASPLSMLEDSDAEMLEAVLSTNPPLKPLLLLINSNGGLPLAAERIAHTARTYAPRGFRTMVVQKAKSAATMVCLGSDQIYMTTTAEMGPIDPQIVGYDKSRRISVDSYLQAYDDIMEKLETLDMETANPVGLIHQLSRFDAAHVEEMRKVRDLGRDMTTKFLKKYMMKNASDEEISKIVAKFSTSAQHKSHGRPIWASEAKADGLNITVIRHNTSTWRLAYELVMRYDHLCQLHTVHRGRHIVKMLETQATTHAMDISMDEEGA